MTDQSVQRFERVCVWIIIGILGLIAASAEPPPEYVRTRAPQPATVCIPIR